MTGNIWMCSHLLDAEDLDFGKHEFITYKIWAEPCPSSECLSFWCLDSHSWLSCLRDYGIPCQS